MKFRFTLLLVLLCSGLTQAQDNIPPVAKAKPQLTLMLNADGTTVLTPAQVNDGSTDNLTSQTNLQLSLNKTQFGCADVIATQEWKPLGGVGISAGDVDNQSLKIAPDGTPYVAYKDMENGGKTTVLRWNGSSWLPLGGAGISAGVANNQSLVIAPNGTPYVAYKDMENGEKTTVLRWNGSSWLPLGGTGISAGVADYQSLAIAPNGTPYVAYQDITSEDKTTILKWNGSSWETLGGVGAIGRLTYYQNLVIAPDGTPYLAYADAGNSFRTSVQKWNGSRWEPVGALGISEGESHFASLVIAPDGTPSLAYLEYMNGYRVMVHTWNGSSWSILGGTEFNDVPSTEVSLVTSQSGSLFIALKDGSVNSNFRVWNWNGSKWNNVEGETKLPSNGYSQSLAIARDGTLYVAYKNKVSGIYKSTVQKFYQSNRITLTVKDQAGNTDVTSTLVNVVDQIAPLVKKKDVTLPILSSGETILSAKMVNNGSSDNCTSAENLLYSLEGQTRFTPADIGQHLVRLKVTDASGNYASAEATITVVNGIPPIAKAKPAVTLELNQNGVATLTTKEVNNGSRTGTGSSALSYSLSQTSFDCSGTTVVEEWQAIGSAGISAGTALEQSLVISSDGTPFVAFQDNANGNKTTVMKWNGINWIALGGGGISAGEASYQSLAISPDGTLYVAYQDNANGRKATVLKWNGTNWVALGGVGISASYVYDVSLKIAPDGTPYLAFDDGNSKKASVLKWNGNSWEAVGGAGISAGFAYEESLAIAPDGTPYVAYRDISNGEKTTVLKWNGSNWEALGGVAISAGRAINQNIAIAPDGTPFIAYGDEGSGYKITVLKWNGSNWQSLGGAGISSGQAAYPSLAIAPDGSPYIAYKDYGNEGRTTVLKWKDNTWESVGEKSLSAGRDYSLAVSPDGTPYVAYRNSESSNKTVVQKFYQSNRVVLTVEDETGNKAVAGTLVKVVDNQAPVVSLKEINAELNAEGTVTISASTLDNGSSDNCGLVNLALDKSTFSCEDLGAQMVKVTVTDRSGNVTSATTTITIQDNLAPKIEANQSFTIDENSPEGTIVGTLVATDNCKLVNWTITAGNTAETFTIDTNGRIKVNKSSSLDYETFPQFSLTFLVSDETNNVSSGTFTIRLNDVREVSVNQAPVLADLQDISGNELDLITFTASATDGNTAALNLVFSLGADSPDGTSIDAETGNFTWTPTEVQGTGVYSILVIVSDGELTDEQELTITINEVNKAPVITSSPLSSAKVGEFYQYQIIATDADLPLNSLAYEALEIPTWLSFDPATQVLSGTPSEDLEAREFWVRLKVGDGTEYVVQEFSIKLEGAVNKPTGLFSENVRALEVSVYPNPTKGNIQIEMGTNLTGEKVILSLLDLEGRLLWKNEESIKDRNGKISIALDGIKAGIYILQINSREQLAFFKIIKQ